jgi:hypothetical protein
MLKIKKNKKKLKNLFIYLKLYYKGMPDLIGIYIYMLVYKNFKLHITFFFNK